MTTPTDEDMVSAAYRLHQYRQGTDVAVAFNRGARWMQAALTSASAEPCRTCGASEPYTGTCGTSDRDTRALCKRATQPAAGAIDARGQGAQAAINAIAALVPKLEDSIHGPRHRCQQCGHAWQPNEAEHHATNCAYVIATSVPHAPPASREEAPAAAGAALAVAWLLKINGKPHTLEFFKGNTAPAEFGEWTWHPLYLAATPAPESEGILIAARFIEERRENFDHEHCLIDPETDAAEYGRGAKAQAAEDYSTTLAELADDLRNLAAQRKDTK